MSKKAFVEELVKRLCEEYNVPRNFEIWTNLVACKFMDAMNINGFYSEKRKKMGVNINKLDTPKEIRATVMHEFRHVWQYAHYKNQAEYWSHWRKVNEANINIGKCADWFSPLELDANRFAKSEGKLDDNSIIAVEPTSQYPSRELLKLVEIGAQIASVSTSLVRPEVLIFLQERGLLVR